MPRPLDNICPDLPFGPNDVPVLECLAPQDTNPWRSEVLLAIPLMVVASFLGLGAFLSSESPCVAYFVGVMLMLLAMCGTQYLWMGAVIALGLFFLPFGPFPLHLILALIVLRAHAKRMVNHYLEYACVEAYPEKAKAVRQQVADLRAKHSAKNADQKIKTRASVKAIWCAVRRWFTYPDPRAPGQWKSPHGSRSLRQFISAFVMLLIGRALLEPVLFVFISIGGVDNTPGLGALGGTFLGAWLTTLALSPLLLFISIAYFVGQPVQLIYSELLQQHRPGVDRYRRDIARLRNHPKCQHYLSMGRNAAFNVMLAFDLSAFFMHQLVTGKTGGGKSTYLLQLIEQLIELASIEPGSSAPYGPPSIITIDLKGDSRELFYATYKKARRMWRITLRNGCASHMCNPMQMPGWNHLLPDQKAQIVLSGLGTDLQASYGKQFFSTMQNVALRMSFRRRPNIASLNELHDEIKALIADKSSGLSNAARRDGELTMQLLDECRNIAPLQATRRNQPESVVEHAVDFREFFLRPTYAHFELSGLLEPKTGPTYARMLITALLAIATMIPAAQRRCPVFLIIDEFQLMANASFARFVEMARSIGVTICLATQTIETSKGRDFDLRATIDGNVGVRRYYSSNTPELMKYIQACCGEFIDYEESVHLTPEGTTYSYKPVRRPRMSQNELIVMTADSHCSLVHVHGKFRGFPFFVKTEYSMTKAEYEAMRVAPWPPADETTVRSLDDPGAAAKPALAPPPPPTKPQQRFPTKLDALGRKRKNRKGKKLG